MKKTKVNPKSKEEAINSWLNFSRYEESDLITKAIKLGAELFV
jgi:hypothetical protein